MPLLTLVAATSFMCLSPTHDDGDHIRCNDRGSLKLFSIDAPRLPGECRRGTACVPGDPIAARDRLRALTANKKVRCTTLDPGRTGSRDVRCSADGVDLSCAMVASGHALERQFPLNCPDYAAPAPSSAFAADTRNLFRLPALWRIYVPLFLLGISIATYFAFAADQRRARSGLNRIADIHLLALVALGGGLGAVVAQQRGDELRSEQPFAAQFAILLGLQFGVAVGLVGMLLWPLAAT